MLFIFGHFLSKTLPFEYLAMQSHFYLGVSMLADVNLIIWKVIFSIILCVHLAHMSCFIYIFTKLLPDMNQLKFLQKGETKG